MRLSCTIPRNSKGPFAMAMRLYWPKEAALDAKWTAPPLTKT